MLRIIKSGFYSDGKKRIIEEIASLTSQGKKSLLIVPEQQTVMTEGYVSKLIPPSPEAIFEVTNFTRLSNTVFRALGGLSNEYCDGASSSLIMWRAITELSPALAMMSGRREVNAGLVTNALAAVSEMQSHGIHPEELAKAAEADSVKRDKRLSDKLSDLSKLYTLYKTLLSEKFADIGESADAMIEKLKENPAYLSDTEIFIEGFTSFTEPQYNLLGTLAKRTCVTVNLTVSAGREDAFEFTEVAECERRLVSVVRRFGSDIKLLKEEGYRKKHDPALAEICALLWSTIQPKDNICLQNPEALRIFESQTPFDECEFIASDIKRRVMDGAAYSDFAIVCRRADKYAGILDSALKRAGIPAFTSFRRDASEFEVVKLIYSAYSAARTFERGEVLTYAKCPLSGIPREECDEFEMYVNKWQINGKRFTDGENWNMNPDGYSITHSEATDRKLVRINAIKNKLLAPLIKLAEMTEEAKSAREQARVLLDFLLEIKTEEKLEERAKLLVSLSEHELAEESRALWGVITDALDKIYNISADSPADRETFLSQLKAVLSSADIGAIPAFADEVTVGSADMLRLDSKPHIYMIGINAGEFPSTVSEGSYFSEHDKAVLEQLGLSVKPELETKSARELYIFSRSLSYASESVTLSYSSRNTRFKAAERAEVIDRICKLTGETVKPIKTSALPLTDRLYSPEDAINELNTTGCYSAPVRDALIRSGYEKKVEISEGNVANRDLKLGAAVTEALSKKPLSLTQSRIDKYVSCPFGHFCRYTVKLSDDERAEFDAASIGSFIHAILENFFREAQDENIDYSTLTAEKRAEMLRRAAEKYIDELGEDVTRDSVRTKIKLRRLCRAAAPVVEGLCEEFAVSDFRPIFFELSLNFDDPSVPDPVTYNKKKNSGETENGDASPEKNESCEDTTENPDSEINIYGTIDRVDTYKKGNKVYLRVVDYKTGQKDFSPKDIEEGKNLQMFLYLKALTDEKSREFLKSIGAEEGDELAPAGVIYVKTAVGDVRVSLPDDRLASDTVKSTQLREGMILDDPDVISAMNLKYTPVYSAKSPDTVNEKLRDRLFTEESFEGIMKAVENSVKAVAKDIREGKIEAVPKENGKKLPCQYCEFKPICRSVAKK